MESLILGLLMIAQLTAYELHAHIKDNYQGIVSPSLGNVQRALKKLEEKGLVTKQEVMSGKVTKKIFTITKTGRTDFMTWLNNPLDLARANNPGVGRLLMLGMLTREQQIANIDFEIADLREGIAFLETVSANLAVQYQNANEIGGLVQLHQLQYQQNSEFYDELLEAVGVDDYPTLMLNINEFGEYTLQLGLAELKFSLEWFESLRNELVAKQKN